jgi:hypothetical protein
VEGAADIRGGGGEYRLRRSWKNSHNFQDRVWKLAGMGDHTDRLCGLVVRVPGCRSRGPGFDSRHYQIF